MPHAYTEEQLVEQPAIQLFTALGWQTVSATEEVFGASGTLGRETPGEVVVVGRLRGALEKLNPALPFEAIAPPSMNRPAPVGNSCLEIRLEPVVSRP